LTELVGTGASNVGFAWRIFAKLIGASLEFHMPAHAGARRCQMHLCMQAHLVWRAGRACVCRCIEHKASVAALSKSPQVGVLLRRSPGRLHCPTPQVARSSEAGCIHHVTSAKQSQSCDFSQSVIASKLNSAWSECVVLTVVV
jgi:hypothetical protein